MLTYDNTVLVFDLDDTLYREIDYQRSGFAVLAALAEDLSGRPIGDSIRSYYEENPGADVIGFICALTGFADSFRETLLWAYRLHVPSLALDSETQEFMELIRSKCHATAILTDGRAYSQMAKVQALGLDWMPVFVSEAWNSAKPDIVRFSEIQIRWPDKQFVYVGDNPAKDFHAPACLGWITIGLKDTGSNIHPQSLNDNSAKELVEPTYWVSTLAEITQLFHD